MRVFNTMGSIKGCYRQASTDTATALTTNNITMTKNSATVYASAVTITCETNDIRWAVNTTPTQGASAVGHVLPKTESIRIIGRENIANLKIISAVAATHGVIQYSPEF